MSNATLFTLIGSSGTEVAFATDEAVDRGTTKPFFSIEIGTEKSAGGRIKQQIRPGKRFVKTYQMNLTLAKYIAFLNLITDNSNNYFIQYESPPELLTADSTIAQTNNFKVALTYDEIDDTVGEETVYKFKLGINSVELL